MQTKITQSLAERVSSPERGRSILYADPELRGFYLIVTATRRACYVQPLVNGKQVRTKLGDHPAMDAKQARDAARQTLVSMRSESNPNEERRKARAERLSETKDALHVAGSLSECAVERRGLLVGANPTWQISLQPVAVGAIEKGGTIGTSPLMQKGHRG